MNYETISNYQLDIIHYPLVKRGFQANGLISIIYDSIL